MHARQVAPKLRQLDLPAYYRQAIVRRLLETELIAASLDEVVLRQRYLVNSGHAEPEIEKGVLRDLETLISAVRERSRGPKPKASRRRPPSSRAAETAQPDMFA
jgi:hypothetical protein